MNVLLVNQTNYLKAVKFLCQKNKMPMEVQLNNMEHLPKFSELDRLCPAVSEIILYILIVAKAKGAQNEFKGQCV